MNDLIGKFNDFEVKPETRISAADKAFLEKHQYEYLRSLRALKKMYDAFHEVYDTYTEEEKRDYGVYLSTNKYNPEEALVKLQNSFVSRIYYYFENTYNVELKSKESELFDSSNFNYRYQNATIDFVELDYNKYLNKIIDELAGLNFNDLELKQLKESIKESIKYNNYTIKGNTIKLDDILYWFKYSWQYDLECNEGSVAKLLNILKAIEIENGISYSYVSQKISGYRIQFYKMNEVFSEFNKDHSSNCMLTGIKIFKNGRVDFTFSTPEIARDFAAKWLGCQA